MGGMAQWPPNCTIDDRRRPYIIFEYIFKLCNCAWPWAVREVKNYMSHSLVSGLVRRRVPSSPSTITCTVKKISENRSGLWSNTVGSAGEDKAQSQPCEGECILAGTDLGTLRSTSQVMEGLLIHHGSGSCDVDVNWKSVGSGFAGVLCPENRNNTNGHWWHSSHYQTLTICQHLQ